jgi:hypothetical protein
VGQDDSVQAPEEKPDLLPLGYLDNVRKFSPVLVVKNLVCINVLLLLAVLGGADLFKPNKTSVNLFMSNQGPYSQLFIFFVTDKWTQ